MNTSFRGTLIQHASPNHLAQLSSIGTGLLLGTALGVIIPEGLEASAFASPSSPQSANFHVLPTPLIALSLLTGFACMLVIEHLISLFSYSRHLNDVPLRRVKIDSQVEVFDTEALDEQKNASESSTAIYDKAIPVTFGLFIHGLTDGLVLGASALTAGDPKSAWNLSLIVFVALIVHKVPTSLALTLSLITFSVPRIKCKRFLAIFSLSTPLGAMMSYLFLSFFGPRDNSWSAIALLISGGSFLYVATVLQPVSEVATNDRRPAVCVLHVIVGMFVPLILTSVLGHGHR